MKAVTWIVIVALTGILVLFVLQNMERMPTIDTKGAYLSLDLYVWGLEQREPISLLWYLLGSFLSGMIVMKLIDARLD